MTINGTVGFKNNHPYHTIDCIKREEAAFMTATVTSLKSSMLSGRALNESAAGHA
jgi:hypothetical protein